jgi:hypothetical protein
MTDRTPRELLDEAWTLLEDLKTEWYDVGDGEDGYSDRDEVIAWLKAAGSSKELHSRIASEALREFAKAFRAADWAKLERRGDVPTYYLSDVLEHIERHIAGLNPGPDRREP